MKPCWKNGATTCSPAYIGAGGRFGLAWLDLSAGRFSVMELGGIPALEAEIERLRPAELLAPDGGQPASRRHPALKERPWRLRAPWHFDTESATRALTEQFRTRDLAGFGCADKPLGIAAAGALLAYVRETQKSALPHLLVHHHRGARRRADHGPGDAPQPRTR